MKIIITGGQGFLGQRLAKTLLSHPHVQVDELILIDVIKPIAPNHDPRVRCIEMDLRQPEGLDEIIDQQTDAIFHLAAIVSSHAEQDPDLGYEINFLATRHLLECCRRRNPKIRFIFTSSLAVYGGKLPDVIEDHTAVTPQSTYGTQKAMCELLINDYSRKGFVDGIVLRLPTICIRPGKPNKAASSFVSTIIREPLHNEMAICPVSVQLKLWLSSPNTVVNNFIHALQLPSLPARDWHVINLPGFTVTVENMLSELAKVKGDAILQYVNVAFDEGINNIVASWPAAINCSHALGLGFHADQRFADVIQQFIQYDM
ncbi:D-erythronate dehydrogenase [Pasteurella multocida]|uniref:D-erythronate dehydrogenase n=1 Tax=Pasteurella multocida TaxID=747 RepID=UPI0002569E09|nr:D-erythronate dehydrogenase [Pasteurella multocida]AFF24838.1 NAD-dependent epimerase/dehydratase family protein [Pasteurella multocida subsp. multocida str. HN06]MCL7776247.1 SDR family oxidoreductase [Pasteurella multocida]MCL8064991.1 SDR family oxidoreductase [Pasteurella multocida]MCL8067014.1 SDR family oxidoreductase [Pasteurella multocida]MCW4599000.1 SDR family oxidoreductase [Pasteurella multocida subsp. multocida]